MMKKKKKKKKKYYISIKIKELYETLNFQMLVRESSSVFTARGR